MAVDFVFVLAYLEVLDLIFQLFSAIFVLHLLLPLAGLVEFFLSIVLFTFFLNDDSLNVSLSQFFGLQTFLQLDLLFEVRKIYQAVEFHIITILEV